MIELSPLARPYAKAIFAAALDAGNHEMVAKDLALLSAVSQTKEVSSLIEDPELSKEEIAKTIISLAEGEVGSLSNKMLELLADNKKVIVEKLLAEHGEGSNIEFSEDPSIMGGLSIKVGDETLDLSIKGKVKKLVNQLNF